MVAPFFMKITLLCVLHLFSDQQHKTFQHSCYLSTGSCALWIKSGCCCAANNTGSIDNISEPAVFTLSFGMEHPARPTESYTPVEVSTYGSGYSGARDIYASKVIDTTRDPVAPDTLTGEDK